MKYFNVVFWVALFGIIFYFVFDSRYIKNVLEPINNKVSDLVEGETPEEIIEKYISSNFTKIIDIEATKRYFCDAEFSLKDACNEMFSNTTYTGEGEKCDQDFLREYTTNKIITYGQEKEKNQESCSAISIQLENEIKTIKLDIEELEKVLSEGRAREYVNSLKKVNLEEIIEPSDAEKFLLNKAKEKQKASN